MVRSADRLTDVESRQVLELAAAAERADGVYPLSEDVVLAVRHGGGRHLLTDAGYAFLGAESGELVVHPDHRRRGHGTALLRAAGDGPLTFWAHGDGPPARAFAEKAGFDRIRVLWQMRRSLAEDLPDAPLPAGVTLRHFRPGHDEQAWLTVNARAFADHPEQGRWTEHDLELREAEPWFDPAGFLLAVDVEDRLLGFHWTKVQDGLGEVYVLGVDPGGHRKGLGRALSVAGLRHLTDRGLTTAILYVDESNRAAVGLYESLGFARWSADVSYQRRR
ncbi:MAG TPA: mycothiol synthase [Actinoplanes sp.]|nr:mycothiol synthase [Actinoplanes sp.]